MATDGNEQQHHAAADPKQSPGTWPGSKLVRAQTHLGELHSRISAWRASAPYTTQAEIAADRLSWRLTLRVTQQPPVVEWSTIAGDCVHNLRSALDAAVWEVATRDGSTPPNPKSLYFPIVVDRSRWGATVQSQLAGVPEEYVSRIESVQPFNHVATPEHRSALELLHQLDIDDKHRAGIAAEVVPTSARHQGQVRFGSDEEAARNTPPKSKAGAREIRDGAVILEETTSDPIVEVKGGFDVTVAVTLTTSIGKVHLLEGLGMLNEATVNTLNVLRGSGEVVHLSSPVEPS